MHSVENLHTVGENWNFLWTFNPLETEFLQTKRNPSLCSAEGRNNIPSGDSVFLNVTCPDKVSITMATQTVIILQSSFCF